MQGTERLEQIRTVLAGERFDALLCARPSNVLMLSGYWPVTGASVAVATKDGRVALLVPDDEQELARTSWAHEVETYEPVSLSDLRPIEQRVISPLRALLARLGLVKAALGWEQSVTFEPISYVANFRFGVLLETLLDFKILSARLVNGSSALADLRSRKTAEELEAIRLACAIASLAFVEGSARLRAGMTEAEAAARFRMPLSIAGVQRTGVARADGFVACMSGPNAATAGRTFAQSRDRRLADGDLVLMRCNSYVDGYWTNVTRTFLLGDTSARHRGWLDAVLEARAAALDAIRPGVLCADVDRAARGVLAHLGHATTFTHAVGHEVGFGAIDPHAKPRLHPLSTDALAPGMVFTVAPAIYVPGEGGVSHADTVAVTAGGCEVLTPFQSSVDELALGRELPLPT